jgi:hypothetical protein
MRRLFMELDATMQADAQEKSPAEDHAPVKVAIVKKERVQCSVCLHENRALIDGLLILGIPVRTLAGYYALTRSAVERHKQNHLPTFPTAEEARAIVDAEKILPPLIEKLKRADKDDLMRSTWPTFSALWKAFEDSLGDSPEDRLRLCLAQACVWLYRIQSRNGCEREADLEDTKQAIGALEAWWDGEGGKETGITA